MHSKTPPPALLVKTKKEAKYFISPACIPRFLLRNMTSKPSFKELWPKLPYASNSYFQNP
jgi:hypothetical protein